MLNCVAQEAKAQFKFRELKRKATAWQEGFLERHGIVRRSGGNLDVLRLAFREFYLNVVLLQNYQVIVTHHMYCYQLLIS